MKKKMDFSIELAGAQEDANWRGGVFLFRLRGLARSLGMCVRARMRRCVNKTFRNGVASADVSRSQSHKAGAFRNGGASAHVSRRRGRRLQDAPPLECSVCSHELPMCVRGHMRMGVCGYACACARA